MSCTPASTRQWQDLRRSLKEENDWDLRVGCRFIDSHHTCTTMFKMYQWEAWISLLSRISKVHMEKSVQALKEEARWGLEQGIFMWSWVVFKMDDPGCMFPHLQIAHLANSATTWAVVMGQSWDTLPAYWCTFLRMEVCGRKHNLQGKHRPRD